MRAHRFLDLLLSLRGSHLHVGVIDYGQVIGELTFVGEDFVEVTTRNGKPQVIAVQHIATFRVEETHQ